MVRYITLLSFYNYRGIRSPNFGSVYAPDTIVVDIISTSLSLDNERCTTYFTDPLTSPHSHAFYHLQQLDKPLAPLVEHNALEHCSPKQLIRWSIDAAYKHFAI